MERTVSPLVKGRKRDVGEMIVTLMDYYKSGQERRDLASKMILSQVRLVLCHSLIVG
jgi:hypothetical protein